MNQSIKRDLNDIINNPNIIVAADKTTNNYELNTNQYIEQLQKTIQKDFKKADKTQTANDIKVQREVVADFDLSDRVMFTKAQPHYAIWVSCKRTKSWRVPRLEWTESVQCCRIF